MESYHILYFKSQIKAKEIDGKYGHAKEVGYTCLFIHSNEKEKWIDQVNFNQVLSSVHMIHTWKKSLLLQFNRDDHVPWDGLAWRRNKNR